MVQVRISEVSSNVTVVKTDKVLILFVCKKIGEIYFFYKNAREDKNQWQSSEEDGNSLAFERE